MLDMLLCYGLATNMIRAGYLGLVSDLFRQVWVACRHAFGEQRRLEPDGLHQRPVHLRAGQITLGAWCPEIHVTSTT